MSADEVANPFGLPDSALWKPREKAPPPTEEQRQATQANLEAYKALGRAIDADFDVGEEMHRRGMKTSAEIAEEQAQAEREKATSSWSIAKTEAAAARAALEAAQAQLAEAEKQAAHAPRPELAKAQQTADLARAVVDETARRKAAKRAAKGR